MMTRRIQTIALMIAAVKMKSQVRTMRKPNNKSNQSKNKV